MVVVFCSESALMLGSLFEPPVGREAVDRDSSSLPKDRARVFPEGRFCNG
jgi:hypothetical protein